MSTILKALRKLEEDRSAQSRRPLREEVASVGPRSARSRVGWLLLFSGVLHFVYAFRGGGVSAVLWELLLAVVYVLIGFYILANTAVGLASLTFVIALYLYVEAILEFAEWYVTRRDSGSGWLLFNGVVKALLAVMIWSTWPSSKLWVIGTLIGVSMLFSGISRLMMSSVVRRITA